ncbi:MAG: GNAT family N-acetyltransferase [Roseiflexaceae bacterium]
MQTEQVQPPTWSIRAYRPGDERALVVLFERVFGRAISEAHWRWKLKQPASPVENVWLAVHGDAPIFQYAGIPTRYRLPTGEVTAMVSVDTMTAPEFQRRGLLGSVGRHVYETWRAAGVPFVIGLPNERWGSRAGALGWEPLFPLQWLARPLRPEAILARRLKWPALARLTALGVLWNGIWRMRLRGDPLLRVRLADRAGPEFDRLWQRCGAETPVSVVRDSAWVNWRYLDAPASAYRVLLAERDGQPVGYAAYRVAGHPGGRAGFIAELFVAPGDEHERRALIARTLAALYAEGADNAITLAVPDTALYQSLQGAGFLRGRGAFSVQIVPLDPALPMDLLRDPHSWDMAGGDFDVI